jgi:hypothetical protein
MEPDVRIFLITIVQTLSMTMLWLLVNMTAGIYFNLGFFEGTPHWYNIVFYIAFLSSFALLIRYFKRKWKGWGEIGEQMNQ